MFGLETVETIRSSEEALCLTQSASSSVAMKVSAPIFIASSFLALEREMTVTFSAPRALAKRTP